MWHEETRTTATQIKQGFTATHALHTLSLMPSMLDPNLTSEEQLKLLIEQHADARLLQQHQADKALFVELQDEFELRYTALGANDADEG